MDAVAFATWLLGVQCLDASQRGRSFQELALAEEHDTDSSHNGIAVAAMTIVEAEAVPLVVRAGIVNAAGPTHEKLLVEVDLDKSASAQLTAHSGRTFHQPKHTREIGLTYRRDLMC